MRLKDISSPSTSYAKQYALRLTVLHYFCFLAVALTFTFVKCHHIMFDFQRANDCRAYSPLLIHLPTQTQRTAIRTIRTEETLCVDSLHFFIVISSFNKERQTNKSNRISIWNIAKAIRLSGTWNI